MRNFDDATMTEACMIYGFAVTPDPVTLSQRQVEMIEGIAAALDKRDREIERLKQLCLTLGVEEFEVEFGTGDT